MTTATIRVRRFDPDTAEAPAWIDYQVPLEDGATVLGGLLHVYEHVDSTLAIRHGCRYKRCGLCAVEVNGRPCLACTTRLRDGMEVGPLHNLPLLRDLAVDRALYFESLRRWEVHLPLEEPPAAPRTMSVPEEHQRIMDCVECLGCVATCPYYDGGETAFGGPYLFLKLAQMHTHPDNRLDRKAQALAAGIERCRDCGRCYCIVGLPLVQGAINLLLDR